MKKNKFNKIILVEDSSIIRRDLNHHLKSFGYHIISMFQDGETFLASENKLEYDFIVMDIYLAGKLNGVETIEQLYKKRKKPVLFLTGTTEKKIIDKAKTFNPLGYLLKPYTPTQLQITFEMALQKWKVEVELHKYKHHLEETIKERTKELSIAKEKAEKSELLKTAFIHNMSHEIRTPLNAIIGFTELLINPKISEDKKIEFVNYIQNSTSTLLTLVDNVWQLSHIQIGEFLPVISKCYVNQIIDEIEIDIKKQAFTEGKKLNFKIIKQDEKPDFHIFTDPTILKRILYNLANNAVKYTMKGFVKISYTLKNKNIIFKIEDSGIGIDPDNLSVIFDLFYKINAEKNKLFRGAGLGLALAKSLAEAIDGNIKVKSKVNKGSEFLLTIPLKNIENNTSIQSSFAILNSDEKQQIELMEFLSFHHLKFSFFEQSSHLFKQNSARPNFNAFIINVLNKEDGLEILNKLKQEKDTPVILLIQYEFLEFFTANCQASNNNYFIIKPLDKEQLIKIFKQLRFI